MTLLKVAAIVGAGMMFATTSAPAGVVSMAGPQLVKPASHVEQIRYVNPGAIIGGVISGNDCGYDNGAYYGGGYGGGYGGRGRGGGFHGGGRGGGGVRISHAGGGGGHAGGGHVGRR